MVDVFWGVGGSCFEKAGRKVCTLAKDSGSADPKTHRALDFCVGCVLTRMVLLAGVHAWGTPTDWAPG